MDFSFNEVSVTAQMLRPLIARHAHRDSRFFTDESRIYTGIGWNFAAYDNVNHAAKEYVRGDVSTNTVEGCGEFMASISMYRPYI